MSIQRSKTISRREVSHVTDIAIAACTFNVQAGGAIQLIPWGEFRAKDGRPHGLTGWYLDERNADRVLATLSAKLDDLVIDYEHQTLYTKENGQPAPAAGWFKGAAVEVRPGEGLFVVPEWTAAAKAALANREYRYLSPVIQYNKRTGEVLDIQMAALVNYAAIDGMRDLHELAAAKFNHSPAQSTQENPMEELLKLFGLAPDASEEDAVTALKALQTENAELKQQVTDQEQAIAAAKAETPQTAVAAMQGLQAELAALKAQVNGNEVDSLIHAALDEGKLVPAQEAWARDLGQTSIASLKGYLESAPAIAALKGSQTNGKQLDGDGNPVLSETDLAVCKQMEIDPDEYKKSLEA